MNWLKIWKIGWHSFFIIIFLFLLNKYLVPAGKLRISYDFSNKPQMISELSPLGRVTPREKNLETGEVFQRMKGEPVYFTVKVPRSFDQAEVTIFYQNPSQKILELGLQKSTEWYFELKPIENKFIDESLWPRLEEKNIILLQKEKKFNTIDEFLQNFSNEQGVVTYRYSLPTETLRYDTDINNVSYLIAYDYTPPKKEGRWKKATLKFDLTYVPGNRKTLDFLLSAPGIDYVKEDIIIDKIELVLTKNQNFFTRLKNKINL